MNHFYLSEDGRTAISKKAIELVSKQGLNLVVISGKGQVYVLKKFEVEDDLDKFFTDFLNGLEDYLGKAL